MIRTSSYTIYVDLPGNSEEMLLVHGYTGSYDKVSRRVATYIRSLERHRPPKPLYGEWAPMPEVDGAVPPPSEQTIRALKRRGYLTEKSPEEEENFLAEAAAKLHERSCQKMPEYIFMPTYDCNLRCSYCFQDHMRTDARFQHLLRVIEPATVDRIFAAMGEIESLHGISQEKPWSRRIGFFGGEPLLAACLPMVEYIIQKALALGPAKFWAVTNGTDLHVYKDLLSREGLSALQITIDGPPGEHDRRRVYADGSGSYARIADNIDLALERGVLVNVRLNVDRSNIAQIPALAREFIARGWHQHLGFSTYTAPVRAENEHTAAETTFDTWELDQALVSLAESDPAMKVIGRPDDSIKLQARKLLSEPEKNLPTFKESFCSAHTRMYIFDAFADLYACWDRTGDPTVRIGKVDLEGHVELNVPVNTLWRSRTVATNPVCRKCRYALQCGGGCAVLAVGKTGRFHANFCDGFAQRFRAGVAEAYLDHVAGIEFESKSGRVCDQ